MTDPWLERQAATSFAQQRLWFLDQLDPGSAEYNLPLAYRLRGRLDRGVLARSLGEIVERHEVLRTTFGAVGGEPMQVVREAAGCPLRYVDLSRFPLAEAEKQADVLLRDEVACPFDLVRGPLFRVTLLRLAPEDHVLVFCMHHIVSDGWSLGGLTRELGMVYD